DGVRALEYDPFPGLPILDEQVAGVIDERLDAPAEVAIGLEDLAPFQWRGVVQTVEHLVSLGDDPADLFLEVLLVHQVGDADGGGALHLVRVRRPDAAPSRADRTSLGRTFARGVL